MSEFKIHHLVGELLEVLGSKASPEEFVELLQKSKTESGGTDSYILQQSKIYALAKASNNPKLFLDKYEELKLKNVDFLNQFIQVICKISEDSNLKAFLAKTDRSNKFVKESKTAAEMTPDDLPQVKNRLLKAIKKNTGSHVATDIANKNQVNIDRTAPSVLSWFKKRPYMSWDFTTLDSLLGHSGEIPLCSQENYLIEDLLNILVGLEGCYIEPKPLVDPWGPRDFAIDESVDISLSELVRQILPLASHYSLMRRFMEEKIQFEYGQVNNALCCALHQYLVEHSIFICQLETELKNGTLNLHKMWFYIQNNLHAMGTIAGICATISKANARGGKVLTLLHEQTLTTIGDSTGQDLCLSLTQCASVPYMNMLETWIYKGVIDDPQKEFLVEDNEIIHRENLSVEDYSADYWAKRYTIRRERIPKFLERVADIILRTGKYLNVIRQCGKTIKAKEEQIKYKIEEREYVETIEKAYMFASRTLLDLLLNEHDLMGRLRSVKHYFLLDKGDFILQFLNFCEKELSKNVNQVLLARLESFLEIAMRMSSANSDPYKEDMQTVLLNDDLQLQMFKILSIQTDDEQEYRSEKEKHKLTGFESFTFGYKVEWPVSLILNHRAVACYQMIFRHLFYCKYVERMLCQIWRSTKMVKKFSFNSSRQYRAAFALRQRMLHCVQNLEYHMMVEVIEPNWNTFQQRIAKVTNIDEVLICHCDFQDKCLEDCMLTSPSLLKTITQLLEICREYCIFIQRTQQYCVEAELCSFEEAVVADRHGYFDSFSLPTEQKRDPDDSELMTPDETTSYEEYINQLDTRFTVTLMELLDQINQVGRDSNKDRLFNLLYSITIDTLEEIKGFDRLATRKILLLDLISVPLPGPCLITLCAVETVKKLDYNFYTSKLESILAQRITSETSG